MVQTMNIYEDVLTATVVSHSITGHFTSTSQRELIIVRTNIISVYNTTDDGKLNLVEEFNLNAKITDIALIPVSYTHLDVYKRQPLSLKSYQEELMRRSMQRFDQLKKEIKENDKILRINRLKETTRQNEIDVLKNDIGIIFKKFQESEISETGLKKRLERLLGESIKLDKSNTVLEGQLEELTGLVSLTDESNIDSKLAEYTRDNTFKDIKLNELTVDNKAKTTKNDDLRMEYQTKSTIAVEKAQTLQDLKRIKKETEERKNGPLNTMTNLEPLLSREKKLKGDLESLVQNSKFLKDLIKSLNDKYPIIGGKESSSSSTSLRDNAGNGNGRYRSRRGNTPNYTR